MKKKAEGMSLRETFAIHRRAARDMRRIAPGCFMPFILCAVVEAASPYAVIWLSARLVDELSTLRRPEILAKWVLWIVAVSAAAELLKAVLERWKNVRSELLDRQKTRDCRSIPALPACSRQNRLCRPAPDQGR